MDFNLLHRQIQQILDDKSEPMPYEEKVGALTAGERTHWAHIRQTMFNRGHNRTSLHCIERAAFNVCLGKMLHCKTLQNVVDTDTPQIGT